MKNTLPGIFCVLLLNTTVAVADINSDILEVQHRWARANYETPASEQERVFGELVADARKLVERYPESAESRIWLAIILSTDAGVNGGLGALGKVREARKLLEAAERINPDALDGSIYTSLGSLYYQVPGWPIGFGDGKKAGYYLNKALSINPDGIDPNYFYGDFMLEEGNYAEAVRFLEKARAAAPRPERPLADKGRRTEIDLKLQQARKKL